MRESFVFLNLAALLRVAGCATLETLNQKPQIAFDGKVPFVKWVKAASG